MVPPALPGLPPRVVGPSGSGDHGACPFPVWRLLIPLSCQTARLECVRFGTLVRPPAEVSSSSRTFESGCREPGPS